MQHSLILPLTHIYTYVYDKDAKIYMKHTEIYVNAVTESNVIVLNQPGGVSERGVDSQSYPSRCCLVN